MPGRSFTPPTAYRYGFNGKEKDDEVSGGGNQYDYGFRIYNPRLGRFLSVDPLTKEYPWYTPYQFAGNKPIVAIDRDGLEEEFYFILISKSVKGKAQIAQLNYKDIVELAGKPGKLGHGTLIATYNEYNNALTTQYVPTFGEKLRGWKGWSFNLVIYGDEKDNSKNTGKKIGDREDFGTFDFSAFMKIINTVLDANGDATKKLEKKNIDPKKNPLEKAKETKEFVENPPESPDKVNNVGDDDKSSTMSESGDTLISTNKETGEQHKQLKTGERLPAEKPKK